MSAARKNVVVVLGIQDKGSNRTTICFGHRNEEEEEEEEEGNLP
jgi:hypothetical protein